MYRYATQYCRYGPFDNLHAIAPQPAVQLNKNGFFLRPRSILAFLFFPGTGQETNHQRATAHSRLKGECNIFVSLYTAELIPARAIFSVV